MASLGEITVRFVAASPFREVNPPWFNDPDAWRKADRDGTLSGVVKITGTIEPNSIVRLYYRPSGVTIGDIRTNSLGEYSFSVLDRTSTDYYLVFITEDDFNALVFDKLTPE